MPGILIGSEHHPGNKQKEVITIQQTSKIFYIVHNGPTALFLAPASRDKTTFLKHRSNTYNWKYYTCDLQHFVANNYA